VATHAGGAGLDQHSVLHAQRRKFHATISGVNLSVTFAITFNSTFIGPPLFLGFAGANYERTGDLLTLESIWPNIEAALQWMERYGLLQGWKDSDDAIFHANGTLARGPIAVCEVQGYAYAEWKAGAALASAVLM
jgi:hypothetical protein